MSNQNVQTILTTVEKTLIDHGFLPKGTGLLLGLSGGADSVMLLVVLSRLAEKYHFLLEAVHVNHMIRGNEATRDEDFCRSLCLKLKVRLHIITENVPKLALQKGTGLEETARDVRYQAFRRILDENERLEYVVTAHNAGDNIETVLFHIARGCGLRGICGIPVKRGRVLRPLLSVSKADIVKALEEDGIRFMDDSTNADTRYTRNYIRRDILPAMRKINPGLDGAVFSMCEHLRDDLDFVEQTAKDWISQHNVTTKANASDLAALHVAVVRRIIPLMYQAAGGTQMLEEVHIEPLIAMISHG
ncbi:MAG: tRNA lysidine(34) synthetase TilS, partial [Clostridia bacterium]|nr:tRNA lysidine(34) synthetase TilS [Clostridia bacterium]